jgi:multiple sugar transport system substrate-binding protein
MLRWKYFVQSEDDAFVALMNAFTQATGVKVDITRESYEDVQPKASVAANTNAGPDVFWGLYSLPHLFPQKCLDVTDVADHLGKKYGGWVESAQQYGKSGDKWISIPVCYSGNLINYRKAASAKAGFSTFPKTTDEFLAYAKAMKANGTPGGFALGHASGDGNGWVHWLLWSFGGNVVDKSDKVILNSPETEKALLWTKELYGHMVPGVASWNDAFNNKAFLANEIHWTNNGISIYVAATNDPTKKDLAEDMNHAYFPVGPIGKPTELHLMYPILAMNYTKYPQACKALIAYMLEAEQFNRWISAARGYLTHCLNAYDANPVWTEDPKRTSTATSPSARSPPAGSGSVGERAATAIADFVCSTCRQCLHRAARNPKSRDEDGPTPAQRIYRPEPPAAPPKPGAGRDGKEGVMPKRTWKRRPGLGRRRSWDRLDQPRGSGSGSWLRRRVPPPVPRLPLFLGIWMSVTDATDRPPGRVHRLRTTSGSSTTTPSSARLSHDRLHGGRQRLQVRDRALPGAALEQAHPLPGDRARRDPDPVHRAHRALRHRLLVDLRPELLHRFMVAAQAWTDLRQRQLPR